MPFFVNNITYIEAFEKIFVDFYNNFTMLFVVKISLNQKL